MKKNIFLSSEITAPEYAEQCSQDKALFHVIPVPFEASVSYGAGTAHGPAAILEASDQLELWDGASIPAELGIYTAPPVKCSGKTTKVLSRIEKATHKALDCKAIPVILGGEHTVTYGALRALKDRRAQDSIGNKPSFGVVQFDAHADLRDTYEDTKWSHACVMRRAVSTSDTDPDGLSLQLAQFGVRAMGLDELAFRKTAPVTHWDAAHLARLQEQGKVPKKLLPADFPKDIYITFDVDGLDPSIMPATGTPVPGGIGWYETLSLLEKIVAGRRVIGFDVVELAPIDEKAGGHAWNFTAARLVYAIMGIIQRNAK
ncbi:MAG: agmatinase [Pseudomonadota bacterium]